MRLLVVGKPSDDGRHYVVYAYGPKWVRKLFFKLLLIRNHTPILSKTDERVIFKKES